jgi:hypothetical protein
MVEVLRALAMLSEPPSRETPAVARALGLEAPTSSEHTALFQLELPPYASLYLGDAPVVGGEARDRVAGFWRALGADPPVEPDHVAALLGLYAAVGESSAPGEARRALLWEHLLSWLPAYALRARELAPASFRAWAELLQDCLVEEAAGLPAPDLVPLHLRSARPVADPRHDGLGPFVDSLLAPARGGVILTRADLVRAGVETGLGSRITDRRDAVRALLAQDAASVLRWLADEARRFGALLVGESDVLSPVTSLWARRSRATAALLDELAMGADEPVEAAPRGHDPAGVARPG